MPKFTIFCPDYENHVPREGARRGLESLASQNFKDFEVIYIHDGPKMVDFREEFGDIDIDPRIMHTPIRINDWGHSSVDFAMRFAKGDYWMRFNIDNMLYPHSLERMAEELDSNPTKILIYSIVHHKEKATRAAGMYTSSLLTSEGVLKGLPPIQYNIDALNAVILRDVWENAGYWYNLTEQSDGIIYPELCRDYNYKALTRVLGENF